MTSDRSPVQPAAWSIARAQRHARWWMILVLLCAFALRLLVFSAMVDDPVRFFQNDSVLYQQLAVSLLEIRQFGLLTDKGWELQLDRTPLYPGLLAVLYSILGVLPAAAILAQALLGTVSVAIAYRLGQLWSGPRAGVLLAFFMSIELVSVFYTNQIMTETLFLFTFLAGMAAWSAMVRRARWQYGLLGGAMLGMAMLTRSVLFYFSPALSLFTVWVYPGTRKRRIQSALAVFLTSVLVIAPWLARNYSLTGQAVISVNQAMYLKDSLSQMRAFQQGIPFRQAREQLLAEVAREAPQAVQQDPGLLAAYYERRFSAEILENWPDYAFVHLRGSLLLFVVPAANVVARTLGWIRPGGGTGLLSNLANRSPAETWQAFQAFRSQLTQTGHGDWFFFGLVGYELLFLALVNVGMVWGLVRCLCTKRWKLLAFVLLVVGYFALVTGPIGFDARYRLALTPFAILMALQVFSWASPPSQTEVRSVQD